MIRRTNKNEIRGRIHERIRSKVRGTPERPRLAVFRSLSHIYAQLIDDTKGKTLVAASSSETDLRKEVGKEAPPQKTEARAPKTAVIAEKAGAPKEEKAEKAEKAEKTGAPKEKKGGKKGAAGATEAPAPAAAAAPKPAAVAPTAAPTKVGGGNLSGARLIGKTIADRAKEKGIKRVVFDRGGYIYHGRVKALADAAREAGLEF
jgi:large subunit ribosomal protein L18